MEKGIVLFVLAITFLQINSQDGESQVEIKFLDPNDRFVQREATVKLDFHVNQDSVYALDNSVQLVREKAVNGEPEVVTLSAAGRLEQAAPPAQYEIKFDRSFQGDQSPMFAIKFTIKSAAEQDDGKYFVQVLNAQKDLIYQSPSLSVYVLEPNKKVEMQFANSQVFHKNLDDPFKVNAGRYSVKCTAVGSNPATEDVKIYWGGKPVETGNPQIEDITTENIRSYRATVMGEIDVMVANSGQDVECLAVSKFGDRKSVKAPVQVNVYDPHVECTSATAFVGQRYPRLVCVVNETGHSIQSYSFKSGKTGIVIKEGEQSDKFDVVKKTVMENSMVKIELILHDVRDPHFAEYYLIINHTNGHVTRESVVLTEVEKDGSQGGAGKGPNDGSASLVASLTTLVFCGLCALWRSL